MAAGSFCKLEPPAVRANAYLGTFWPEHTRQRLSKQSSSSGLGSFGVPGCEISSTPLEESEPNNSSGPFNRYDYLLCDLA